MFWQHCKWNSLSVLFSKHFSITDDDCILSRPHITRFYQIRYNMKRRVIAEDRVIWLKSGTLRSTLSHYTIKFLRLCFSAIRHNLSQIFEHVQNITIACDSQRFLESWPTESWRVSHYMMLLRCWRHVGQSQAQNHVVWGLLYTSELPYST